MFLTIFIFIFLIINSYASTVYGANNLITINFFYSNECPYCQKAHQYFNNKSSELKSKNIEVLRYDVKKEEAKKIYIDIIKKNRDKIKHPSVPLFEMCGYIFVGFSGDEAMDLHIDYITKKICNKEN